MSINTSYKNHTLETMEYTLYGAAAGNVAATVVNKAMSGSGHSQLSLDRSVKLTAGVATFAFLATLMQSAANKTRYGSSKVIKAVIYGVAAAGGVVAARAVNSANAFGPVLYTAALLGLIVSLSKLLQRSKKPSAPRQAALDPLARMKEVTGMPGSAKQWTSDEAVAVANQLKAEHDLRPKKPAAPPPQLGQRRTPTVPSIAPTLPVVSANSVTPEVSRRVVRSAQRQLQRGAKPSPAFRPVVALKPTAEAQESKDKEIDSAAGVFPANEEKKT